MLIGLKRKRIMSERREAVGQRHAAARDLIAALREAEAAVEALKSANDKFYRSDVQAEQVGLDSLRRSRERMFAFLTTAEVIAEAPILSRLLGLRVSVTRPMPLVEWIDHVSHLDLGDAAAGAKP